MALLEISDLDVHYGGIHALKGVSLKVEAGEVVTLIGANGAGKTTTLRAISGLITPSGGSVTFAGAQVAQASRSAEASGVQRLLRRFGVRRDGMAPHEIVARGLVHAPEGRGIFSNMTVDENLEIGAFLRDDRDAVAKDREHALSLFPRLKERLSQSALRRARGDRMDPRDTPGRPVASPHPSLSRLDVVAIIVGLVIGAGIFKAPAIVAANVGSEWSLLAVWAIGGAVSLAGALCYAELASAYPSAGGEYHFLTRAYGRRVAFLFAWSRLAILQTGSIALLAFVLGDYLAQLAPLDGYGAALYAAVSVIALTGLNIIGLRTSTTLQNVMTVVTLAGLLFVVVAGLGHAPVQAPSSEPVPASGDAAFGLAMVFVLLTFGGWNESAYVSAELRDVRRNMVRVLVTSLGVITLVYLLVNVAYLNVLGLEGMRGSEVVTADVMRYAAGDLGAGLVSALIAVAVAASINVSILTGARTNYAMANDFPLLGFLAGWSGTANAPKNALLVQGAIALALVAVGATARSVRGCPRCWAGPLPRCSCSIPSRGAGAGPGSGTGSRAPCASCPTRSR